MWFPSSNVSRRSLVIVSPFQLVNEQNSNRNWKYGHHNLATWLLRIWPLWARFTVHLFTQLSANLILTYNSGSKFRLFLHLRKISVLVRWNISKKLLESQTRYCFSSTVSKRDTKIHQNDFIIDGFRYHNVFWVVQNPPFSTAAFQVSKPLLYRASMEQSGHNTYQAKFQLERCFFPSMNPLLLKSQQ